MNTAENKPTAAKASPHWFQLHRIAMLIILFGIVIRLPLVLTPFNSMDLPWRIADTDSIARNFTENGYHILYPQINWGGAGPGYVEAEFQFYPFVVALFYGIFGEHYQIARLVSLTFTILACILFYALARQNIEAKAANWALAFFVIVPLYLRLSVEIMPEATDLCFYLAALYTFQRWLDESEPLFFAMMTISTAMAILVKPTSIHIGFIFLFFLLQRFGLRAFQKPLVWLFGIISLVPGAAWYWHAHNLYSTYGNTFGILSGGDSKFGDLLSYWLSPNFYISTAQIDLNTIFANAGVVVFVLGTIWCFHKRQSAILLFSFTATWIYYLLVPRYISTGMGSHYHIYFAPFAALGIGVGIDWLFRKIKPRMMLKEIGSSVQVLPALLGVVIVAAILFDAIKYYRGLFTLQSEETVTCAQQVKLIVPAADRIIVSSEAPALDNGVANNYQDPLVFYVSWRFGWSLASDQHNPATVDQYRQKGAAYFVIFQPKLYYGNPDLVSYLNKNSTQVGPGINAQCGIYKLNPYELPF